MGEIIQLFILLMFVTLSAKYDANAINRGDYIDNHLPRWLFRLSIVSCIALFSCMEVLGLGLIFTSLFDPLINRFRGKDFWYLGTVAYWDRFFNKHKRVYEFLRYSSLSIGLYIIFIY